MKYTFSREGNNVNIPIIVPNHVWKTIQGIGQAFLDPKSNKIQIIKIVRNIVKAWNRELQYARRRREKLVVLQRF